MRKFLVLINILLLLLALSFSSCTDDSEDMAMLMVEQDYLIGDWNITAVADESDTNLLAACENGKLSSYTFTEDNKLNVISNRFDENSIGNCESTFIFYTYTFDEESNIITIKTSTGGGEGYNTRIIEASEDNFVTQYVSGSLGDTQLTIPNFTTTFERK